MAFQINMLLGVEQAYNLMKQVTLFTNKILFEFAWVQESRLNAQLNLNSDTKVLIWRVFVWHMPFNDFNLIGR